MRRAASLLHIEPFLDRYPARLSGGQRQRVAVARALAVEPAVLLMDEPLSNLDALLRLEMRSELKAVLREAGTTTIYVTHDQTEAMGLPDRIAVMYGGGIDQVGPPLSVYATPATRFVGSFLGNPPMNFVKATAERGVVRLGTATLPCPVAEGPVEIGLRGEDAALAPSLAAEPDLDGASRHRAGECRRPEPDGAVLDRRLDEVHRRRADEPADEARRGRARRPASGGPICTMWPPCITAIRSARPMASVWSWVT